MPGYEGAQDDGKVMECLARIPNLLQRGKDLLPRTHFPDPHFTKLKSEVTSLRQNSKRIIMGLRDRLYNINTDSTPVTLRSHIHAHYLRMYGMGLATGIILNCILSVLEEDCLQLHEESSHHSNEIFQLAESAVRYQPLGSVVMILCLSVARLGAPELATKDRVKSLLSNYIEACLGIAGLDLIADLERMKKRFTLQ